MTGETLSEDRRNEIAWMIDLLATGAYQYASTDILKAASRLKEAEEEAKRAAFGVAERFKESLSFKDKAPTREELMLYIRALIEKKPDE